MKRSTKKHPKVTLFLFLLILISYVNLVPPDRVLTIIFFYIIAAGFFYTLFSFFLTRQKNLMVTFSLLLLLFLKQLGQLNIFNIAGLIIIDILLFFYFQKTKEG